MTKRQGLIVCVELMCCYGVGGQGLWMKERECWTGRPLSAKTQCCQEHFSLPHKIAL